jgi:BON domain-containing protein
MRNFSRLLALLTAASAGAGAAISFFLDPTSGRRRRHEIRDRTRARGRRATQRTRRLIRHTTSDFRGYRQRALHQLPHRPPELDDATLAHKVESIVFRDPSVPKGRINVNAERGVIYLRGQLDTPGLIRAVEAKARRVSGVRGIVSLLHLPETSLPERQ